MQAYKVFGPDTSSVVRHALVLALICCAIAALAFVVAESSTIHVSATLVSYWAAVGFAGISIANAALGSKSLERIFWGILGVGLMFRFMGHTSWASFQLFAPPGVGASTLRLYDVAHLLSYLFFLAALLWLTIKITRKISALAKLGVLVTVLDTFFVMLSVGSLVWYFVLGPAANGAGIDTTREVLAALRRPVFDAALLFLSFAVFFTTRRSLFAGFLVASFAVLLAADAVYLHIRSSGPYEIGAWPEVGWALGIIFLGLAAARSEPAEFSRRARIEPRGAFLFWCGPLSPALHYAVLFAWGMSNPPMPTYVMLGGMALLLYLAFRVALSSRIDYRLAEEQEEVARSAERGRILRDLHDTAKQSARATTMMIESCMEARKKKPALVGEFLERAATASRDAERQLSKPMDELRVFATGSTVAPTAFFTERFDKFGKDFGMEPHANLQAPLEALKPDELAVAHRVCIEAVWNAAKHSGARNLWLDSEYSGSSFVLRVRDDGHGFSPEEATQGMGIGFMRSRAEEIGAEIEVFSAQGKGTTVELRFVRDDGGKWWRR